MKRTKTRMPLPSESWGVQLEEKAGAGKKFVLRGKMGPEVVARNERLKIMFDDDDQDLRWRWWGLHHDYAYGNARRSDGTPCKVSAHRIVSERMVGRELLKTDIVDHRDGNPINNRRNNLRITDYLGNSQNRPNHKFRGAHKTRGGRWFGRIKYRGKEYLCGTFDTRELAADAAAKKREELHFLSENNPTDMMRMDWLKQMANECEGRILTQCFVPNGKSLRHKIDEMMKALKS